MTLIVAFRTVQPWDPAGPLCRAHWEPDLAWFPWEKCRHDSCWAITTGGKTT